MGCLLSPFLHEWSSFSSSISAVLGVAVVVVVVGAVVVPVDPSSGFSYSYQDGCHAICDINIENFKIL
jgi:hypothetical protein